MAPDTAVSTSLSSTDLSPVAPYDALLLFSFGGPDGPDDVLPFLRNVTAGQEHPRRAARGRRASTTTTSAARARSTARTWRCRRRSTDELARRGIDLPVVWGNRNWEPYTTDALSAAYADGARRVVALVTSAYSSYSGCRQYRENLWASLDELGADVGLGEGEHPLAVDKVRSYFNHPGFVQANVDAVTEAFESIGRDARLVFVTHSIPDTMEEASAVSGASYSAQHLDVAATVAAAVEERLGRPVAWDLAYCSRSGPPSQPWLEPDVNDHLTALAADGVQAVVLSPIGFVSDHMEVAFDLDTEALETAAGLGLVAVRADTVGTREPFVRGLVDLVLERAALARAPTHGASARRRRAPTRRHRSPRPPSVTCRRSAPSAGPAAARCAPGPRPASPPPARPTPGPDHHILEPSR